MARIAPLQAASQPEPVWPDSAESATATIPALSVLGWNSFDNANQIARWDALAQWAVEPNPFYESWYLLPSLRTLDPAGKVQLACLEVDGQLAGLMPIRRHTSYYGYPFPHLRNWVHDNCFCGQPLVAPGLETHFWRALLDWCDGNARTSLFLHLMHMPGEGPLHGALKSVLEAADRPAATVLAEQRAMLKSDLSPGAYLEQAMVTKRRKELRRQYRRLEELGALEVQRCSDAADIEGWTQDFLHLEASGWKGREGSAMDSDPAKSMIFAQSLYGAATRGRLERLSLVLDGRPIAMLATFVTAPGAYSYKTAFAEAYSQYSPGVLLQRENLSQLDKPQIDWVDSCAVQDHKMIDHIWRERRPIVRHSVAVGGAARRKIFTTLAKRETGNDAGGIT